MRSFGWASAENHVLDQNGGSSHGMSATRGVGLVAQVNPRFGFTWGIWGEGHDAAVVERFGKRAPGEFATKSVSNSPWLPELVVSR
jgi:hypothetical protein